jgi:hypothetical protein
MPASSMIAPKFRMGLMVHRSPYNGAMAEPRTVLIFGKDT